MGLIKAALGSAGGVLADQWREFFYCDSMPENILVTKGQKRTGNRSSNTKGTDNIISNGSVIAVNEGQCMMIVDQGQIVEFAAEAGEFTWNSSTEGSCFYGGFGNGLKSSWNNFKRRFTFGGDTGKDQRVYFFNLKEIMGNKYGTPSPVPFRVVDTNIGLDMDISIRCNGEYSYRITDPILFYKNVSGNVTGDYTRDRLDSQLKSEFLTALQPAFAEISAMGIRYSALPGHADNMAAAMNNALSAKWSGLRGISVVSVGVNSVNASPEDEATIKELQKSAVFRNTNMAAAHMVQAQAEAMKAAASNENGAMMGFMGMNMAQAAGGAGAMIPHDQAVAVGGEVVKAVLQKALQGGIIAHVHAAEALQLLQAVFAQGPALGLPVGKTAGLPAGGAAGLDVDGHVAVFHNAALHHLGQVGGGHTGAGFQIGTAQVNHQGKGLAPGLYRGHGGQHQADAQDQAEPFLHGSYPPLAVSFGKSIFKRHCPAAQDQMSINSRNSRIMPMPSG